MTARLPLAASPWPPAPTWRPALSAAALALALSPLLLGCDAALIAAGGADLAPASGRDLGGPTDQAVVVDSGPSALIQRRPYRSLVPSSYDPARAWPLVVLLHGYGASGSIQDAYFRLSSIVEPRGVLFAFPDGTLDPSGRRFWNADDACCDLYRSGVDDVAYLEAVIDDMAARYHVDSGRVFLVGHSNGAFMAHRLACEAAGRVAAIAVLAGDVWKDPARCQPSRPVSVLQVHGDADLVVLYGGGQIALEPGPYPSAMDSVGTWAQKGGCHGGTESGAPLDLDSLLPGAETSTLRYLGCQPGGAAELWTLHGGSHIPALQPSWPTLVYDWLAAHGR